jgi:hypothetical protein
MFVSRVTLHVSVTKSWSSSGAIVPFALLLFALLFLGTVALSLFMLLCVLSRCPSSCILTFHLLQTRCWLLILGIIAKSHYVKVFTLCRSYVYNYAITKLGNSVLCNKVEDMRCTYSQGYRSGDVCSCFMSECVMPNTRRHFTLVWYAFRTNRNLTQPN